jgi:ABC-type spermidine/putrescine transport system permease subunit II
VSARVVWGRRLVIAATLALLFTPLLIVVALSFNDSRFGTLPFEPSLRWYRQLLADRSLFTATRLSVQLSVLVALASAVVGTMLATWLVRYGRRLTVLVNGALLSAVTIPWLILGIAMLVIFNAVGIGRSWTALFLGCLVISLPYHVFIVVARLRTLDPALEEAARSLGASAVRTQARVILPLLAPAILGGSLMAFVICFNNFVIQYFLAPFGVRTLPLEIYTLVRTGYQPDINALATIVIAATLLVIVALQWLVGGVQRAIRPGEA